MGKSLRAHPPRQPLLQPGLARRKTRQPGPELKGLLTSCLPRGRGPARGVRVRCLGSATVPPMHDDDLSADPIIPQNREARRCQNRMRLPDLTEMTGFLDQEKVNHDRTNSQAGHTRGDHTGNRRRSRGDSFRCTLPCTCLTNRWDKGTFIRTDALRRWRIQPPHRPA